VLAGRGFHVAAGKHVSRKISLQQEKSGLFFLLNVFLPAEVLRRSG
jgi:hypothetical protein